MAKTVDKVRKPFTSRQVPPAPSQQATDGSPSKTKLEIAKEYLNKFHPGWDAYLNAKDN